MQRSPLKGRIGFPGIISLETEDLASWFRRRTSRGPFLLIGRNRGLALDTAYHEHEDSVPILWSAHAEPQQLWYFRKTEHRGQFLVVAVLNGLALDAGRGSDQPRQPTMSALTHEPWQRWRLHPTEDGAAFIVESVHTGHVLDVPHEAGPETRTPPVLWTRHGAFNQQWLIVTPSGGPV